MKTVESMYDIDWAPRMLIEASAGTGKTYTLTAQYVRLLTEKNLAVDQILVMTFTNKATSELKDRIFRRLKECLGAVEGTGTSKDGFAVEFAKRVSDRKAAARQLKTAIQNFDDSQVYTIHGFCQKILKEEALLAGTPFEFEVATDDDLLTRAVEDFWRIFMNRYSGSEAGRYYISKLLEIAENPSILKDKLHLVFSKPYATLEGEEVENPVEYLEKLLTVRNGLVETWKGDEETLLEILNQCDVSRFQQHFGSRLKKLRAFLDDRSFAMDVPESLGYFTSDYLYDTGNLPKSGNPRPTVEHRFFDICTKFQKLAEGLDKVKTTLIGQAVREIIKIRDDLSIQTSRVTYDDLLKRVEKVLRRLDSGQALAKSLQKKYPAALVDEFQDTDPIQFSILNSIYPPGSVDTTFLMIGDPKQAIYAFRGADVHTYLQAKKEPSVERYTLHRNYRSTPVFNSAVNTLFGYSDQPFIENGIDYADVESGLKETESCLTVDGEPVGGIKIITGTGIDSNKADAEEFVYSQTVNEIVTLLKKAGHGDVKIDGRNLEAGDIAILVSDHRQAESLKKRLKSAGVDSVTYSKEKVFESPEARRLNYVMAAVLDPYDRTAVNNALVSGFWGQDLNEVYELSVEGGKRQEMIEELQQLGEIWQREGFYAMFRKLLFSGERMSKLAQFSNSERLLTNLYQLAGICSKAEREGALDPHSLYSWFTGEMADPGADEERTLLLESDQNLVKISTVHNSKGLEFPVVFCPTLWDVKSGNRTLFTEYHTENGDPVIRYDQQSGDRGEKAEALSRIENTAEEVRKYYVALTRARYQCVIPWAHHCDSLRSGMILSLLDRHKVKEIINNKLRLDEKKDYTDRTILEVFKKLENKSGGSLELKIEEMSGTVQTAVDGEWKQAPDLKLTSYKGRVHLEVQKRMESFSSLTSHSAEPGEPDYDQVMESYLSAVHRESDAIQGLNIFGFPRGATAGTAVHKLFEDELFHFETAATDDHSELIERVFGQFQINEKWLPVAQEMIRNVVLADIPDLCLDKVKEADQLREMEFQFTATQPSLDNILGIIRKKGQSMPPEDHVKSFLTGFIDLIVRQNGKYYILDYKSNYLGDSVENYSSGELKKEIYNASYDVQYHLYTVALIKYLKSRKPGFDYESDFGGVVYLFIRGMRKGKSSGIWFHKPDKSTIQKLSNELEVKS